MFGRRCVDQEKRCPARGENTSPRPLTTNEREVAERRTAREGCGSWILFGERVRGEMVAVMRNLLILSIFCVLVGSLLIFSASAKGPKVLIVGWASSAR
jgi:hypothetical protein